jgi:type III pantothenate kinase
MAYNLTIDQGNTAAKLALWTVDGKAQCVAEYTCRHLSVADINNLCAARHIDTAIYCSVSERNEAVLAALHMGCSQVIELSVNTPMPITVDYRTPNTLGVDRLAAAVGAHSLIGAKGCDILVADIGTAITYDVVTADNCYRGGNIAPVIFMRLKALNCFTARLPQIEPEEGDTPMWGYDTETALRSGAINGVVAELEYYHSQLGDNAIAVLTGGGAELVCDKLSFKPIVVPNLVNLGLNSIINFNLQFHTA